MYNMYNIYMYNMYVYKCIIYTIYVKNSVPQKPGIIHYFPTQEKLVKKKIKV